MSKDREGEVSIDLKHICTHRDLDQMENLWLKIILQKQMGLKIVGGEELQKHCLLIKILSLDLKKCPIRELLTGKDKKLYKKWMEKDKLEKQIIIRGWDLKKQRHLIINGLLLLNNLDSQRITRCSHQVILLNFPWLELGEEDWVFALMGRYANLPLWIRWEGY